MKLDTAAPPAGLNKNNAIRAALAKRKIAGAAPKQDNARQFPPERVQANGQDMSLQEASLALEELMDRATQLAGCSSADEFRRLPKQEQNAFLAQAGGEKVTGIRSDTENRQVYPRQLVRSPFNRDNFDEEQLQELRQSIEKRGVLQALIVRPWRPETIVGKLQFDDAKAHGLEMYEIIAGERRWRAASLITPEIQIPVTIRDVDDEEAIEIQAEENLKREDLNPLDEAAKYSQLREIYMSRGATKEQAIEHICEKLQRGRSTVHASLRFLELPQIAQEEMRRGRLPKSHADLFGKISDPAEIEKLTCHILYDSGIPRSEPLPFRETKELVAQTVKRLENLAEWQRQKAEFEQKGLQVLDPKKSERIVEESGDTGRFWIRHEARDHYILPDQQCYLPGGDYREYRKLWKKTPAQILARTKEGQPVIIYDRAEADAAVKAGGKLKVAANGRASSKSPSDVERERRHKFRKKVFEMVLTQIVAIERVSDPAWDLLLRLLLNGAHSMAWQALCKRRGWDKDNYAVINEVGKRMTGAEMRALAVEFLLHDKCTPSLWSDGWGDLMKQTCKQRGIDLVALEKQVQTSGGSK